MTAVNVYIRVLCTRTRRINAESGTQRAGSKELEIPESNLVFFRIILKAAARYRFITKSRSLWWFVNSWSQMSIT